MLITTEYFVVDKKANYIQSYLRIKFQLKSPSTVDGDGLIKFCNHYMHSICVLHVQDIYIYFKSSKSRNCSKGNSVLELVPLTELLQINCNMHIRYSTIFRRENYCKKGEGQFCENLVNTLVPKAVLINLVNIRNFLTGQSLSLMFLCWFSHTCFMILRHIYSYTDHHEYRITILQIKKITLADLKWRGTFKLLL